MSMQDPIADLLTRIRNGQSRSKRDVTMPSSKVKTAIVKVLQEEGYIEGFSVEGDEKKPQLTVTLKYHNNKPVIELLKRVSRPGLRTYKGSNDLPEVMNGLGVAIVSTPKGVMSERAAKSQNLGGEVLCFVA